MKYVLAFIGMLIGKIVGEMITSSHAVGWFAGAVLGLVAYQIPAFLRYIRSNPQQLLSFYGQDSPITGSTSSGEIQTFLAQLHDGGLLIDFDPQKPDVLLDRNQWTALSDAEKKTMCRVLTQATIVDGNSPRELRLLDRAGSTLALYSTTARRLRAQEVGKL